MSAGRLSGARRGVRSTQCRPVTRALSSRFKGNKQSLPSKPCVVCGRAVSWRKRWARTWDEVKFCSGA
ncbi:MAG: DUF2256 domain-containing protein, partial [Rhizobacter sp.]|nr:DUF2256 domain-containing protein [Rhizobacter sp.]